MSELRKIFEYTDPGGDWVRVEAWANGQNLSVTTAAESAPVLDADDVRALHTILGTWLAERDRVKCLPAPLTPGDVRAIVTEHVASVMPLYLAPFSALLNTPAVDPEPGDVGHPRPAVGCTWPTDACTCTQHRYVDASPHPVNDRASAGAPVGPTWDDKVWGATGTPPGTPECIECTHEYRVHFTGKGCLYPECACARYRSTR